MVFPSTRQLTQLTPSKLLRVRVFLHPPKLTQANAAIAVYRNSHVFNRPGVSTEYARAVEQRNCAVLDADGMDFLTDDTEPCQTAALQEETVKIDGDVKSFYFDSVDIRRRVEIAGEHIAAWLRQRDRKACRIARRQAAGDRLVLGDRDLSFHPRADDAISATNKVVRHNNAFQCCVDMVRPFADVKAKTLPP